MELVKMQMLLLKASFNRYNVIIITNFSSNSCLYGFLAVQIYGNTTLYMNNLVTHKVIVDTTVALYCGQNRHQILIFLHSDKVLNI